MANCFIELSFIEGGVILKNKLRIFMAENHLNISTLALKTGISRNTIANIYHEKNTRIDIKTITKLCNFFGCTPNDLIIFDDESKI